MVPVSTERTFNVPRAGIRLLTQTKDPIFPCRYGFLLLDNPAGQRPVLAFLDPIMVKHLRVLIIDPDFQQIGGEFPDNNSWPTPYWAQLFTEPFLGGGRSPARTPGFLFQTL